jgi:hypothetical protein
MRLELEKIQRYQAEVEKNDAWLIPITLKVDEDNPVRTVLIPDLSAVIILDFDE